MYAEESLLFGRQSELMAVVAAEALALAAAEDGAGHR